MLLSRMETLQMHSRRGFEVSPPSVYGRFLRWSYLNLSSEKSLHTVQSSKTIKTNQTTFANCFHLKPLRDHAGSFNLILSDALEDLCLDLWIGSFRRSSDSQVGVPSCPCLLLQKKWPTNFTTNNEHQMKKLRTHFFLLGGRNHKNFTLKELDLWRFWRCHRPRLLRNIFALIDAPIVANEVLVWTQRIHRKCMVKACGTGLKCVKHVTFDLPNIFLN